MRAAGLHRTPPRIDARHGAHIVLNGISHVNFGSNDYLGLGTCAQWQRTVQDCFAAHAPSASSSRLVTGHLAETELLESAFAARFGYDECLFFPSGYQANMAVITGLLADADAIFFDKRIHASMAHALTALGTPEDGPNLCGYAHGDLAQLQHKLRRYLDRENAPRSHESALSGHDMTGSQGTHAAYGKQDNPAPAHHAAVAVLTESLFSMDGNALNLPALHAAAPDAVTIVDEAHAVGALGPGGLGLASHRAVQLNALANGPGKGQHKGTHKGLGMELGKGADIVVGTLGKALGLFGAFVLMPQGFKEFLTNFAAPVIYSTAMPPAFAACALAAVDRIATMDAERAHLARLGAQLRSLLTDGPCPVHGNAHIVAVEIGEETRATRMASALRQQGLLVFAARHPTVPAGQAILRISLTAAHTEDDIMRLAAALHTLTGEIPAS
ncbi:MAG: aminotransferase class I/II-fold pyridoxal phosphate-dependent enzyme [Halodesulfovibrio sp.]